jgi:hypothetical protein
LGPQCRQGSRTIARLLYIAQAMALLRQQLAVLEAVGGIIFNDQQPVSKSSGCHDWCHSGNHAAG